MFTPSYAGLSACAATLALVLAAAASPARAADLRITNKTAKLTVNEPGKAGETKPTDYFTVGKDATITVEAEGPALLNLKLRQKLASAASTTGSATLIITRDAREQSKNPLKLDKDEEISGEAVTKAKWLQLSVPPGTHTYGFQLAKGEDATLLVKLFSGTKEEKRWGAFPFEPIPGAAPPEPAWVAGGSATPAPLATPKAVVAAKPAVAPQGEPAAQPKFSVDESRLPVRARMRVLADKLAEIIMAVPNGKYLTLAVTDLTDDGPKAKEGRVGALATAELITNLARDHNFALVERGRLQAVLEEQGLSQSGALDDTSAIEVGKLVAAQLMIFGNVTEAGPDFAINARVVSTETGRAIGADGVNVPSADMIALSADAVVLRSKGGAAVRSLILPGWGQLYAQDALMGGAFFAAEAGLFATAIAYHYKGNSAHDSYKSAKSEADAIKFKDESEAKYRTRNTFIFIGGGVWLINVLHAYITGPDPGRGSGIQFGALPKIKTEFTPVVAATGKGFDAGGALKLRF